MNDLHKTKLQLIDELSEMRNKISKLKNIDSDSKQMEKALKESEQRLRNITEHSNEIFYIHDTNHNLSYVSPASKQIMGYTPNEMKIKWTDLITDNPINEKGFRSTVEALETGKKQKPYLLEVKRKDGQCIFVEIDESPLKDDNGKVIGITGAVRDVTDRLFTERVLNEEKDFIDTALNSQADTFFVFNPNTGKAIRWNKAFRETSGYSDEEITKLKAPESYYCSEDMKKAGSTIEKVYKDGMATVELSLIAKSGKKIPTEYRVSFIHDEQGEPKYMISIGRDVSDRKEAERAVKESEEKLRTFMDSALDGFGLFDSNLNLIEINDAIFQFLPLSITKEQIIGKNLKELTLYATKSDYYDILTNVVKTGEPLFVERTVPPRLPELIEKQIFVNAFKVGEGLGIVVSDITDLKKAEKEIKENEENLRLVFKTVPDALYLIEQNSNKIIDVNDAAVRIYGYKRDEWLKMKATDVSAEPEKTTKALKDSSTLIPVRYHKKKDGTVFPVEITTNSINLNGNQIIIATGRDITEKKQIEEEIKQKNTELLLKNQELLEAKGKLQKNEAMLKSIFRVAPTGIGLVSDRILKWTNEKIYAISGYSEEELRGKNARILYPSDEDFEYVGREKYKQIKKYGTGSVETKWKHKNGSIIDVFLSSTPINSENLKEGVTFTVLDITKRKKMEEKVLNAAKEWEITFESIKDSVAMIDLNGRIFRCNNATSSLLGKSSEQILGMQCWELVHGTKGQIDDCPMDRMKKTLKRESMLLPSGEKWFEVSVDPVFDEKGILTCAVHIISDVTENKRAEDVLRIQRDFAIALSESKNLNEILNICLDSAIKISGMDCGGVYLVNENTGSLDLKAHKGLSDIFIKNTSSFDAYSDNMKMIKKGKPYYKKYREFNFPSTDFRKREGLKFLGIIPVYSEGKLIACLNIGSHDQEDCDENSRKNLEIIGGTIGNSIARGKSEEALKKSQSLLTVTGKMAKVGGWEFNVISQKLEWTEEVYHIHELDLDYEPSMEGAINFYSPDSIPIISEAMQNAINKGNPFNVQLQIITAKRTTRWVRAIGKAEKENKKIIKIWGTFQDITDRKLAEEEIHKLNDELEMRVIERTAQLEAANKELEAFSYSVSHDLRAPLHHISGFSSLLEKRAASVLDEKSQHYLDTIGNAAEKMGNLIDDLLNFSRTSRTELYKSKINFKSVLDEVKYDLEQDIEKRKINWKVTSLPEVYADHSMLRLVIYNLIANAVKFTIQKKNATIEIGTMPDENNEQVFFVGDNGVGFNMKYANKLFGVFQRLHREEDFKGTGIGLANVRRIINRHGGRTWAKGEEGKGATFYFSLPKGSVAEGHKVNN